MSCIFSRHGGTFLHYLKLKGLSSNFTNAPSVLTEVIATFIGNTTLNPRIYVTAIQ